MRAFGALPIARADENLAGALAFFTMKFINWHEVRISCVVKSSSAETSIKKAGIQEKTIPAFLYS
jgi:hypothetical protein